MLEFILWLPFALPIVGAVVFKGTSDFSAVIKDQDKLIQQNIRLKQQLKEVTDESKKQDAGFKNALGGGLSQIKSMVTGYVSLQGAIALVNKGLEEQNRLSNMARQVQLTAADAQAEVIKNLGGVTTAHASRFLSDVQAISKDAGAESVAPVLQAAASTLSGTGGNEALTKNILREAVPLFKNKLEELPDFAGAVGDLASITGAASQEEIRRTVGLVLTTQSQARIQSLDAFKNAAPALAAVATTDTGEDRIRALREGGALFAAIGGAIKDPEGALTKTATSEVATSLAELLPEKDMLNVKGDVVRKGTGLKTLAERLARVQSDPALQREFMQGSDTFAKASFRGPITPVVSELISRPDSEAAQRFQQALTKVQDDPAVVSQMMQNLATATPELAGAGASRSAAGNVEGFQLGGARGTRSQVRDILGKTLEQTRPGFFSFLDDKAQTTAFDYAISDEQVIEGGIASLSQRAHTIRSAAGGGIAGQIGRFLLPGFSESQRSDAQLSESEREQLVLIKEQIQVLRDMKQTLAEIKEQPGPIPLTANREGR